MPINTAEERVAGAAFDEKPWSRAVAAPGTPEREAFLFHYAPLVKVVVSRIAARLPKRADVPDLYGEGVLGLIDAVNRFDPGRGVPFGAYARRRIQGAVLDAMRAADPLPRRARRREGTAIPVFVSLDDAGEARTSPAAVEAGAGGRIPADASGAPLERLLRIERVDLVRAAVEALPEREKLLMSLYYVEELTMKEIGEVMGVTESRVCQLHRSALAWIKARLAAVTAPEARLEAAAS